MTPEDVQLIVPVDYENDSVGTSLAVARALDDRLWGVQARHVRVHGRPLGDRGRWAIFRPTGVNPHLVWNVRNALDAEGFGDVQIVVSGGFDLDRIRNSRTRVPVDAYGIGASAHEGRWDFTARRGPARRQAAGEGGTRAAPEPGLERVK